MAQGEQPCLVGFAHRRRERDWRALYGERLTFTAVADDLASEEVVRRAQEQCEEGEGVVLVRIVSVPAWWNAAEHGTVDEDFFRLDGVVVVHPLTFQRHIPSTLAIYGNDLRVVEEVERARARA